MALLLAACAGTAPPGRESATGPRSGDTLPAAYADALALMAAGDHETAIPVLEDFIKGQPDKALPWLNLGIALHATGQAERAFEALYKASQINPELPAIWNWFGILQREQGAFDAALKAYRRALDIDPDYALAHRNLGILYDLYLQQPQPALAHYRKYLELAGEDKTVEGWVVDLKRRHPGTHARVTP